MKSLSKDLKRMLNALALQDVGDFLPRSEKLDILGGGDHRASIPSVNRQQNIPPPPPRRVALLSDGTDITRVLQYALEACQRQHATLDLVLYGKAKQEVDALRVSLERSGVAYELILLGNDSADVLCEYLCMRRTLIYLVAPADDPLALKLTEEVLPRRGGHTHLPIVLIDRNHSSQVKQFNHIHAA